MIDWNEKYRPKTLDEVIGNAKAVDSLKKWARSWESGKPRKKAVVLIGDSGVGKTSSALALASDFGWSAIELNASDIRNAAAIKETATRGAMSETFTSDGDFISIKRGGRKLIVLDEADNIFGKEDFGGIGAIVETIRETKQPIILIVNDYYGLTRRSSAIKQLCQAIRFNRLNHEVIVKALRNICQKEGIKASIEVLNQIAEHSLGDLRAAVNDLQSLSEGKEEIDKVVLGYRDAKTTIFASLAEIFKGVKCQKSRQSVSNLDETPDHIILWIDENLPLEYKDLGDLARGYDALSKADIYLGMVKRRQHYGFWSYAMDMMTAGVSLAKRNKYRGYTRYNFPMWLIKMSRTKRVRNTSRSLATKLGDHCHASNDIVLRDIMPYFKHLFATDRDFRINMTHILKLNEDEVGYLLGEKVDSYAVKHVVDGVERLSESKKIKTIKEFEKKEKQAGLFDF